MVTMMMTMMVFHGNREFVPDSGPSRVLDRTVLLLFYGYGQGPLYK